jgi:hypothetical protein
VAVGTKEGGLAASLNSSLVGDGVGLYRFQALLGGRLGQDGMTDDTKTKGNYT